MEMRETPQQITRAEWIARQHRDQARFLMGRRCIAVVNDETGETIYQPVEIVDPPPERAD